jgi:uncharacterized protein (DUF488 family)
LIQKADNGKMGPYVRRAPYSRKPGFSKKALESILLSAGIGYVGIPELGTERAIICHEADPRHCHRQFIEERLEYDGFRIIHLDDSGQVRHDVSINAD